MPGHALGTPPLTDEEDTGITIQLMENLRSPRYRVGPPSAWEGRRTT